MKIIVNSSLGGEGYCHVHVRRATQLTREGQVDYMFQRRGEELLLCTVQVWDPPLPQRGRSMRLKPLGYNAARRIAARLLQVEVHCD